MECERKMKNKGKMWKGKRLRGSFDWFIVLVAVVLLYFSYTAISQQLHLNQIHQDYQAAQTRLEAAKKENDALVQEKSQLDDLGYIEKVAREELGMTKNGEMPYISADK